MDKQAMNKFHESSNPNSWIFIEVNTNINFTYQWIWDFIRSAARIKPWCRINMEDNLKEGKKINHVLLFVVVGAWVVVVVVVGGGGGSVVVVGSVVVGGSVVAGSVAAVGSVVVVGSVVAVGSVVVGGGGVSPKSSQVDVPAELPAGKLLVLPTEIKGVPDMLKNMTYFWSLHYFPSAMICHDQGFPFYCIRINMYMRSL